MKLQGEAAETARKKLGEALGMWCINNKCSHLTMQGLAGRNNKADSVNMLMRSSSIRTVGNLFERGPSTLSACHIPE